MKPFLKNKYTNWYLKIIQNAKNRTNNPNLFYEKHHIIPLSLKGKNTISNLVKLTPKEHFICHLLLTKMVECKNICKMVYALNMMANTPYKAKYKRYNSTIFQKIRIKMAKYNSGKNNYFYGKRFIGANNPFYGKTHSDETKEYLSKMFKGKKTGINNHFYGKKHTKKTKQILKDKQSIPIEVLMLSGEKIILPSKESLGVYLGKSKALGKKLNNKKYSYLHKNYGIASIREKYEINKN